MLKLLLNRPEVHTEVALREVCRSYGARVFAKVRVADVLPIEHSCISSELYRYALQAHFDFVAAEESTRALFAVEFDGPSHVTATGMERDQKKAALCKRFECPLLRINSRYLTSRYRGINLLAWCIESWFLQRGFEAEQAAGRIRYDEPFDAFSILRLDDNSNRFPLWLSCDVLQQFRAWAVAGLTLDPGPSCILGVDRTGSIRALAFIRVDSTEGVVVRSAMRSQLFPIDLPELLNEVALFDLHESLKTTISGTTKPLSIRAIKTQIDQFMRDHTFLGGHYVTQGSSPLTPNFRGGA
jgi:hypothetical protein